MKHRRIRKPFRHAPSRRLFSVAALAAAAIAAGSTGSVLFTQPSHPVAAHEAANAAAVDMTLADGGDNGRADRADRADRSDRSPANPDKKQDDKRDDKKEDKKPDAPKPPAEKELKVDFQYQPNFYYCGPASTRIALTARGINLSQDELAKRLGTDFGGTDSAHDITRELNKAVGTNFYKTREIKGTATPAEMDRLQADAVHAISNGYAIVANIAGGATDTSGFWRSFPGGHYVTIVGYSDEGRRVQVADPSGVGPSTYWMTTINMATWMSTRGYSA